MHGTHVQRRADRVDNEEHGNATHQLLNIVVENATGIPARLKFAIKRFPVQVIIFYV